MELEDSMWLRWCVLRWCEVEIEFGDGVGALENTDRTAGCSDVAMIEEVVQLCASTCSYMII